MGISGRIPHPGLQIAANEEIGIKVKTKTPETRIRMFIAIWCTSILLMVVLGEKMRKQRKIPYVRPRSVNLITLRLLSTPFPLFSLNICAKPGNWQKYRTTNRPLSLQLRLFTDDWSSRLRACHSIRAAEEDWICPIHHPAPQSIKPRWPCAVQEC